MDLRTEAIVTQDESKREEGSEQFNIKHCDLNMSSSTVRVVNLETLQKIYR